MSSSSASPGAPEKAPDETSKIKTFLSILRKFIGVTDIANIHFSLPAQLLEPTPNLEYWNYLDRPETFVSIGKSDEPLGRMLEVLRFWFTKDLKYIKGKLCKPYNSSLGEFFRCNWETEDTAPAVLSSGNGGAAANGTTTTVDSNGARVKISYLTEQTSHHPPVSAYYVDCPDRGVSARGYDQISAKFTGTSIRVSPGEHNHGIFITLKNWDDEEYRLTHPHAHLSGLLRGALTISVADTCYITCPKTRIKVILQYLEEGWLGRTHNKVEGVICRYDPDNDTRMKISDVPEADILARITGSWQERIYYTLAGSKEPPRLLIDIAPLFPADKILPPDEDQLPNESRKFWSEVTAAILDKRYSQATKLKQDLEERQRQKAAARKAKNEEWVPRFFTGVVTPPGRPELTEEGKQVLRAMHEGNFKLEESRETGT
ncbi:hypothetical protein VTN02DRAFT_3245 [Thermoascus thermophilus]